MTFLCKQDRIIARDDEGSTIAEVTFPAISEHTVCISRTVVIESLGAQEIESELYRAVVKLLRADNRKAAITCPRASKWFRKNPEYMDVLYSSR